MLELFGQEYPKIERKLKTSTILRRTADCLPLHQPHAPLAAVACNGQLFS